MENRRYWYFGEPFFKFALLYSTKTIKCIAPDTGTQLAHYNGVPMTRSIESREACTLELSEDAQDIQDVITVTWVIMETMTRGQNPASTPGIRNSAHPGRGVLGSGGDGGSWGNGGGDGGYGGDGGGGGD
ncbi:hypothetical protein RSAG8_12607, partial [Rhizoctonia solani AG-8 WAC10335]